MSLIDAMAPDHLETALFSFGDFRDSEALLGSMKGVWRTCVGYVGGIAPDYGAGNHAEAVLVEYAPQTVSYGQLLELFMHWRCSAAFDGTPPHGAIIFFKTEKERRLAQAAIDRNALCGGERSPTTHILPFKAFQRAGNSLQKHYLHVATWLYEELLAFYKDEDALLRSTLAARLNGYLGQSARSFSSCSPEDMELYGLNTRDVQTLRALMR